MKRLLTFSAAALALTLAGMLAFADTVLIFQPGERKNVWLEVSERDGMDFTLDTAEYRIVDEGGADFLALTDAEISGTRIYSSVDAATWAVGSEYKLWVYWEVDETDERYINIIQIDCGEELE